ncbi:MAG TPA: hypothetical protein VL137_13725 [Polyangiaceae bacterium]|jgi:hypothetical protein|nr:hypothetical protein [Polyangiaceae bacterium]
MNSYCARRTRRLAIAALLAVLCLSGVALAGTYLNRALVLVKHSGEEAEFLRSHLYDLELARITQRVAEARLRAARETQVPKEVEQAHPHLLLLLEHYERAASAALESKPGKFAELVNQAHDEEQIFRSILRQFGWPLPDEH